MKAIDAGKWSQEIAKLKFDHVPVLDTSFISDYLQKSPLPLATQASYQLKSRK
jgi:hypothetical protein